MAQSILVAGGTGTLGQAVVARLTAAGAGTQVRVLSRGRRDHPTDGAVRYVVGDITTGAGLTEALAGVDTVIACVDPLDQLVSAAQQAAPQPHLVYISIVGIDRVPLGYYQRKLADERLLADSSLPHTVLRATQFHDLVAAGLRLASTLPVLAVPAGWSFQPIDVRDVAVRLVDLALGTPAGRVEDIGGPQVVPVAELARRYLTATRKRRPVVSVPLPGRVARGYRAGGNCCPDRAVGEISFEEYLGDLAARGTQPYAEMLRASLRFPRLRRRGDSAAAE